MSMDQSRQSKFPPPDRRPERQVAQLHLPPETQVPPPQTDLDVLKEEIKGLSATMMAISSQMSTQTKTSKNSSKVKTSTSTPQTQTTVPGFNTSITSSEGTSRLVDIAQAGPSISQDNEELEDSSDSEEDSSDDNCSEEGSDEDCEETTSQLKTVDGNLDWPSIVSLIVDKFSDRIPVEEDPQPVARIGNLGGMVEKKDVDRVRLPMHEAIRTELVAFSNDISVPPTKAKAKRDSKPLGRGIFPENQRTLPVQALAGDMRFNHPLQLDQGIERLLPGKKQTFSVQGKLTEENLRKIERDLRVNLSSLSYALWNVEFATQSLISKSESCKDPKDKDSFIPIVSACRHALSFLSTVVDRSSLALATSVLVRRDSYLSQMDSLLPEEEQVKLRASSFLDTKLFAGNVAEVIPRMEDLRKESQNRQSVDALTTLAKKGVETSSTKNTTSASTSGFSKKKNKKSSKKKTNKKNSYSAGNNKSSTETTATGSITRTFRNKSKKSNQK